MFQNWKAEKRTVIVKLKWGLELFYFVTRFWPPGAPLIIFKIESLLRFVAAVAKLVSHPPFFVPPLFFAVYRCITELRITLAQHIRYTDRRSMEWRLIN